MDLHLALQPMLAQRTARSRVFQNWSHPCDVLPQQLPPGCRRCCVASRLHLSSTFVGACEAPTAVHHKHGDEALQHARLCYTAVRRNVNKTQEAGVHALHTDLSPRSQLPSLGAAATLNAAASIFSCHTPRKLTHTTQHRAGECALNASCSEATPHGWPSLSC